MNTPNDSSLGREVAYPAQYDPGLLFPIPRAAARAEIGLVEDVLPFTGDDRWHAYELGWLDLRGKPCVATATLHVPASSPNLVESKSLKLYLNSLNAARFADDEAVRARIAADLSACAGASVQVAFLRSDAATVASEMLLSALLKSNCPVTGQPDWASVSIRYQGPRIDRAGLLRYLVSYRDHAEFHEQCVERIFLDLLRHCGCRQLEVEARYTRRGGLDINPRRATAGLPLAGCAAFRDARQ